HRALALQFRCKRKAAARNDRPGLAPSRRGNSPGKVPTYCRASDIARVRAASRAAQYLAQTALAADQCDTGRVGRTPRTPASASCGNAQRPRANASRSACPISTPARYEGKALKPGLCGWTEEWSALQAKCNGAIWVPALI